MSIFEKTAYHLRIVQSACDDNDRRFEHTVELTGSKCKLESDIRELKTKSFVVSLTFFKRTTDLTVGRHKDTEVVQWLRDEKTGRLTKAVAV